MSPVSGMRLVPPGPALQDRVPVRGPAATTTTPTFAEEVAALLRQAEQRAVDLLRGHRGALDRLAALLIEQETVDGAEVQKVLDAEAADGHRPRVRVAA